MIGEGFVIHLIILAGSRFSKGKTNPPRSSFDKGGGKGGSLLQKEAPPCPPYKRGQGGFSIN
jgi:hypothetical protein